MNGLGDKNNFFKNPIGIIGIFLVLTEAIASIVIVKSRLSDMQNTVLVIFIVLFPCLVLFAFYLLVTRHHEKLYSPADYKDESNFVSTYNSVTQKNEVKELVDAPKGSNRALETMDVNLLSIKDTLASIMEMQKKMVSIMKDSDMTEDEKSEYISFINEYLEESDEDDATLKVEVSPMYKGTKLVEELQNRGYIADIYYLPASDKKVVSNVEHQAIWLGIEVPVDMAINVIRIAKKYYPHLRYIQLNDCSNGAPEYVKYEVYIGGATETAKRRKLKVLRTNDFNTLYSINDKAELHDFIRKFEM